MLCISLIFTSPTYNIFTETIIDVVYIEPSLNALTDNQSTDRVIGRVKDTDYDIYRLIKHDYDEAGNMLWSETFNYAKAKNAGAADHKRI